MEAYDDDEAALRQGMATEGPCAVRTAPVDPALITACAPLASAAASIQRRLQRRLTGSSAARCAAVDAGTIFKRFDPGKLFVLVGQDVTERFHLLLSVCFVLVEVREPGTAPSLQRPADLTDAPPSRLAVASPGAGDAAVACSLRPGQGLRVCRCTCIGVEVVW